MIKLQDAGTCFLVSQLILEENKRSKLFSEIAESLKAGGVLVSSCLASNVESLEREVLLHAWTNMMSVVDISLESVKRMRRAYTNDVGALPSAKVASVLESGRFELPARFFLAGLIHAWLSTLPRP